MLRVLLLGTLLLLVAYPAMADTASKDGTPWEHVTQPSNVEPTSNMAADWEYNTGGAINTIPTTGGSASGWGEWFITTVLNDSGNDLVLTEFGFPCGGPPTGPYGWVVWLNMPGLVPPPGDATTAQFFGAFTPVDPAPAFPPTIYTYVDVSAEGIVVPAGTYFCFGYDNTDLGGQIDFNGVQTWAWYLGTWDPDVNYGRTAVLQVSANFAATPVEPATWGQIKTLFE